MKEKVILELSSGKRSFYVDDYEVSTGRNLNFMIDDPVDISDESRFLTKIRTLEDVCQSVMENLKVANELIEEIQEESRHLTNWSARRARQDIGQWVVS